MGLSCFPLGMQMLQEIIRDPQAGIVEIARIFSRLWISSSGADSGWSS